jgi:hypothetical protein
LGTGDHLVGVSAVADRIAKIYDGVINRDGGQTGFKRLKVAMYVAKEKNAHKVWIIAWKRVAGQKLVTEFSGRTHGQTVDEPEAVVKNSGGEAAVVTDLAQAFSEGVLE